MRLELEVSEKHLKAAGAAVILSWVRTAEELDESHRLHL